MLKIIEMSTMSQAERYPESLRRRPLGWRSQPRGRRDARRRRRRRLARRPPVDFRLLGVTDRTLLACGELDGWLEILCGHGLSCVMIREKDLDEDALCRLAVKCRPVFNRHNVTWFVNGSVHVAKSAGATGAHLTSTGDVAGAREALGMGALIGKSVHALAEASEAERAGVDFLVFGPVYATPSKAGYGSPQGIEKLRSVCTAARIPVFAIGGVTPGRARDCLGAGASGVAAVSSLMRSPTPRETLGEYERCLEHL